ncbi:MAG: plasmid recombination protein [Erysipelotrichaceae bacterium]|nr:plasmid recombination protein [Erysipelotrichaceae bacterium]
MQYNFHNEKYQTKDITGIKREQFREYAENTEYRNDVDNTRSKKNVYIEMSDDGFNWYGRVKDAKKSTEKVTGKATRKDAVVICSTVEAVPQSWDDKTCIQYFEEKGKWYDDYLQKKGVDNNSMLSIAIHLDETTPHATYVWIPMRNRKLQAKNIVTKEFLIDLQKDSQEYTMNWVHKYNHQHSDVPIETLDPYISDSQNKHLSEQQYKEKVIAENIQQMEQHLELTRQQIGDLEQRDEELTVKTQEAVETKQLYENKFIEITNAPDIESYDSVVKENVDLKEELSLKDRIIERLQEESERFRQTIEDLKETAEEWKNKFTDMAHKAGFRLMEYFGYDVKDDSSIRQFPSREVSAGISKLTEKSQQLDPKSLRVIPDSENERMFRVVSRQDDGTYQTVQGGFTDRDLAEQWKKNYTGFDKGTNMTVRFENKSEHLIQ